MSKPSDPLAGTDADIDSLDRWITCPECDSRDATIVASNPFDSRDSDDLWCPDCQARLRDFTVEAMSTTTY